MIKRIEEHTKTFPSTFYNDEYWYMPLPVSQDFIESHKTPRKVKRLCIQTLIDRVNHLIKIKPSDTHTYRVVALISIENLWRSQIIVFKNDDYFHNFFNRNNEFQKWILLSNEIDFWETWEFQFVLLLKCCAFKKSFMMRMQSMKKRFGLLESYLKRVLSNEKLPFFHLSKSLYNEFFILLYRRFSNGNT